MRQDWFQTVSQVTRNEIEARKRPGRHNKITPGPAERFTDVIDAINSWFNMISLDLTPAQIKAYFAEHDVMEVYDTIWGIYTTVPDLDFGGNMRVPQLWDRAKQCHYRPGNAELWFVNYNGELGDVFSDILALIYEQGELFTEEEADLLAFRAMKQYHSLAFPSLRQSSPASTHQ